MTSLTRRVLTLTAASLLLSFAAALPALAQDLTANPSSLAFGDVYIGVPSGSKVLTITNVSGGGITINSISFDCAGYGITSGVAPFSFGLTQSITHYSIYLAPTAAQNYNCNFVMSMSDGTEVKVPLTGTGVVSTGNSNLNQSSFSFPNQKLGSTSAGQTVTISNTGTGAIQLTGITLSPPSFTTNNISLPANIAAGGTLPVTVYYTPSGVESETGALDLTYTQVPDNGVTLNGNGIAPTSLAVISPLVLPQATQSGAYETTLAAAGGSGSYTWALASGSTLPSGLTLSGAGAITGTIPSTVALGNYTFTVKVTDTSTNATANSTLSIGLFANMGDNCNDISFDVPNTTTPMMALTDLGTGTYQGSEGGLYPNGSNVRPASHDSDGVALAKGIVPLDSNGNYSPTGKYVMMAIGESTAQNEFGAFQPIAAADPATNPYLVIVNGAQGGGTPYDYESSTSPYWATVLNNYLPQAGVTPNQVVVIWVEDTDGIASGTFPTDIAELQTEYENMMQTMHNMFPNLKMVYFSSRVYGGYSNGVGTPDNPEPYAYEVGFAVKWAIQDQLNGNANLNYNPLLGPVVAPWMSWGPYYWSNGMLGRKDGLEWDCADFAADGTHPSSPYGQGKVATALLDYLKTDDTTTPWYMAQTNVLTATGGNNQSGTVSTALPTALTVSATKEGTAVSGVSVSFTDGSNGTFKPNPAVTNSSGIATTTYTLPSTAGTYTVTATSSGYVPAAFTETATVPSKKLAVNGGNNQTGVEGTALPTPLTVAATSNGTIVAGLSVTFKDNKAGGSFNPATAITNSSGIATTTYTLPTTAKIVTITAGAIGYTSATFTETSIAAGKIITVSGGNKQSGAAGTTLPTPLSVTALNNGVPVAGLSVSFVDGKKGSFSPNPAITNSSGVASTSFTLPATAGNVTVTAGSIGYTSATFTETVTAPIETLAVNGGNNQSGNVSTTLPTPLTVLATKGGTATAGVSVAFTDGGVGGVFSPNPAVSNSSGIASTSYTLPATAQTVTITASSSGYSSATFSETATSSVAVTQLGLSSGGKQTGTVGTTLPLPIVIEAKGAGGVLVVGAPISFTDGVGGTFSPNPAITNSSGLATTTYTLPTVAQSLVVTASDGSVTTTASEKSVPAAASKIAIVSGNNQSANPGTQLPSMLIVSVTDQYGNAISGYTVDFSDNGAGGSFSTTTPVTNSFGQAGTSYTTGSKVGTVTITAGTTATGNVNFTETVN
jgi:hypothetical protein